MKQNIFDLINMKNKTAVITGGAGHLGLRMSEVLLELGAKVVIIGQLEEKSKSIKKKFGNKVCFIKIDLNNEKEVLSLSSKLPKKIDICINNSFTWPTNLSFEKIKWGEVGETLVAGIISPLFVSKIAFEKMTSGGSIINISSMYGMVSPDFRIYKKGPFGSAIEYGACKSALIQITRYLAVQGASKNIRVNSVSPGPFSKPGTFNNGKEWFKDELIKKIPLARIGENWELKGVIAFLASDMSTYVTGQNIPVDGGWTIW